ncbi:MAG: hypothetical protein HW383_265 [Candidatus Magasanikbacteria bacterium]|nr:hypothetical protein [Candidatus Magasanikbacteria bacterium]
MRIEFHPKFRRKFKRIPSDVQQHLKTKINFFIADPSDPRLHVHALHGKFDGYMAFSVTYKIRIIFKFTNDGGVWFYDIGDHDIYD